MAQQDLLTGAAPNDNTGEFLRAAMVKIQANFSDIYGTSGNITEQIQDIVGAFVNSGTNSGVTVVYDDTANTLTFTLNDTQVVAAIDTALGQVNWKDDSWSTVTTTVATDRETVSINNGKLLIDGVNENGVIYKRTGTIGTGNHVDPVFETGRITGTGIGEPTWRILYRDSGSTNNEYLTEGLIFAVEPSGTVASVRRVVGSHFEGFIDGDTEPFFRLESIDLDPGVGVTPSVRLRMGPGGTTPNDVELIRRGANQLSLALGGSNKWTTFADGFQLESGITQNFVNTPSSPSPPPSGVLKIYNLNGVMVQLDNSGTETVLSNTATSGTGTNIPLNNPIGYFGNMTTPNSATTYTTTGTILGAWAKIRINAATQPSVTGATLISGDTFTASTDMYLFITYNGNIVEYYFRSI